MESLLHGNPTLATALHALPDQPKVSKLMSTYLLAEFLLLAHGLRTVRHACFTPKAGTDSSLCLLNPNTWPSSPRQVSSTHERPHCGHRSLSAIFCRAAELAVGKCRQIQLLARVDPPQAACCFVDELEYVRPLRSATYNESGPEAH